MRLGQEWIRTTEGVKPADLQAAPSPSKLMSAWRLVTNKKDLGYARCVIADAKERPKNSE